MTGPQSSIVRTVGVGQEHREAVERLAATLRSTCWSRMFPLLGAILSLGAPAGFLVARALATGRAPTFLWTLQEGARAPGTYLYLALSTMAVLVPVGYVLGRLFDGLLLLSITDPLTGLFNRRRFAERLVEETRRARRFGRTTCVLCLDIDRLKAINDRFGHKAGDQALVAVCRALSQTVRAVDTVARIGGDELAVILPETSAAEALTLAQRILTEIAQHGEGAMGLPTVSIGIAELDADGAPDNALAAADAALYRAKLDGGGRAALARPMLLGPRQHHSTLSEAARLLASHEAPGVMIPNLVDSSTTSKLLD